MQVKLFAELFTSKFQSLFFKILRAGSDDEVAQLKQDFAHNLEVRAPSLLPHSAGGMCTCSLRMLSVPTQWSDGKVMRCTVCLFDFARKYH